MCIRRSATIASGIAMVRTPAGLFGGPRTSAPATSEMDASTRTVRRVRSTLRSASTSAASNWPGRSPSPTACRLSRSTRARLSALFQRSQERVCISEVRQRDVGSRLAQGLLGGCPGRDADDTGSTVDAGLNVEGRVPYQDGHVIFGVEGVLLSRLSLCHGHQVRPCGALRRRRPGPRSQARRPGRRSRA